MPLTKEQRIENLRKGRETAAANRARKAAEPAAEGFVEAGVGVPMKAPEAEIPKETDDLLALADLTDEDRTRIYAKAKAQAIAEIKAKRIKELEHEALDQARIQYGGNSDAAMRARNAEMVDVVIDVPEEGGGSVRGVPDGVFLDQRHFRNGHRYRVCRAQYDTIMDIMCRRWMAEAIFDGKQQSHYTKMRYHSPWGGGAAMGTQRWHA